MKTDSEIVQKHCERLYKMGVTQGSIEELLEDCILLGLTGKTLDKRLTRAVTLAQKDVPSG